jgi:Domain of Unknown Function (DUF1080)
MSAHPLLKSSPFLLLLLTLGLGATAAQAQATKEDSGWVPLFNGKDFDGFYGYFTGTGTVDAATQDAFYVDSGMVHVRKKKASGLSTVEGHLITFKQYSWYKIRLDYRFENVAIDGNNAGLVLHIDSAGAWVQKVKGLRPRSIEVNMNRVDNSPWTLWSAGSLGPYISTTVQAGTNKFLPKQDGGVAWTNDPWGQRIVHSTYANPENPFGQWNHGEATVYGDSMGIFTLNGKLRTQGWNFRDRGSPTDSSVAHRVPVSRGEIGIQSEQQEVWYKNIEIMELEPHTLRPLNAKPTALAPGFRKAIPQAEKGQEAFLLNGRKLRVSRSAPSTPAMLAPR